MSLRLCFASVLVSSLAFACGGSAPSIGDPVPQPPDPGGNGEGSAPGTPDDPAPPGTTPPGTPPATGPRVLIKMRGSTAAFTHVDAFSGSTPKKQVVAIRSLLLLRSPTDPNPVQVFDHGAKSVEADLVTGKTIDIASVVAKTLPAGVFTVAKAGVAYVRYTVDARMHSVVTVDGQYENVQALSDGAVIDGVTKDKGHFRYSFVANGMTYGTLEGEDAPTPAVTGSGGVSLDTSGPQAFYVFPIQLAIDPNITKDHEVMLELNVHESFRWQDQAGLGYAPKVFDTTPSSFEPVMAFGANAFKLTVGPAQ
jgi:hypothetical protein